MSRGGSERGLRRSGLLLALAALALAGLILPAAAPAGDESTDLGSEKGLNYRVNIAEDYPGTTPFDSFAACADGDRPISGGIDLELSAGQSRMGGTYPAQEGELYEWRSVGTNLLGGSMDMSFFAVCRKLEPGVMKFRSAAKPLDGTQRKSVKAACPKGFEVTGGGVHAPADLLIQATAPYDGKDSDHKPDDGWKATAIPNFDTDADLLAYASCRRASSWDLKYVKEKVVVGSNSEGVGTEVCTDGVVTGGGGSIVGDGGLTRMHETYPADVGDGDDTPADGWTTSFRNGGASATNFTDYAICKT